METFSALLALCAGNSPVTDEFPSQRRQAWSFDIFFDLRLNKRSKQSWGWWFETLSRSSWRHCNGNNDYRIIWYQTGVKWYRWKYVNSKWYITATGLITVSVKQGYGPTNSRLIQNASLELNTPVGPVPVSCNQIYLLPANRITNIIYIQLFTDVNCRSILLWPIESKWYHWVSWEANSKIVNSRSFA